MNRLCRRLLLDLAALFALAAVCFGLGWLYLEAISGAARFVGTMLRMMR